MFSGPPPLRNVRVSMRIDPNSGTVSFKINNEILDPLFHEIKGPISPAFTLCNCMDQVTILNVRDDDMKTCPNSTGDAVPFSINCPGYEQHHVDTESLWTRDVGMRLMNRMDILSISDQLKAKLEPNWRPKLEELYTLGKYTIIMHSSLKYKYGQ